VRWLTVRHGRKKRRKDFLKLHFIVDCRSLLILSFKVTSPFKADSKQVEELLAFIGRLGRLCADKAYFSRKICDLIAKHGGRWAVHLDQEECRQNQEQRLQSVEGDAAGDVPEKQETLQEEEVPSKEPCRDSGLNSEEEVQPHAILQEEKGSEERTQTEGINIQPIDNLQTASQIRVVCQSPG
jgi:hypothetical protein